MLIKRNRIGRRWIGQANATPARCSTPPRAVQQCRERGLLGFQRSPQPLCRCQRYTTICANVCNVATVVLDNISLKLLTLEALA